MKILIVTDAYTPQVNGVVTTLTELTKGLEHEGHEVVILTHTSFKTFAIPQYPEIRLAYNVWKVPRLIKSINPDAIHIATPEGTIGLAARCYCVWKKIPYTSSYHTKFPEYLKMHSNIPTWLTYPFMRWLHKNSKAILVPTPSMLRELKDRKFKPRLVVWTRGADEHIFNVEARHKSFIKTKILLYAGRISIEKNLDAFLKLDTPNAVKVIVGDGPDRTRLESQYGGAWLGYKTGKELAEAMAMADVFVFPSKTDTFGLVMIEAAYCGTPVAAFPVTGPIDFVAEGKNGSLNEDLEQAIKTALEINRQGCADYTKANFSWQKCAKIFLDTLAPIKY